jgi:sugar phosphate permease
MGTLQKVSWTTISVRLAACALIGIGFVLFSMGLFMSHGTASMCVAGIMVIVFALVLIRMNPRKPTNSAFPNPNASERDD